MSDFENSDVIKIETKKKSGRKKVSKTKENEVNIFNKDIDVNVADITFDEQNKKITKQSINLGIKNLNLNNNNTNNNTEKQEVIEKQNDFNNTELQNNNNLNNNYNNNLNQTYQNNQQQFDYRNNKNNNRNNYWQQKRNNIQQPEDEYVINTEQVIDVKDLREKSFEELLQIAEKYEVQNLNRMLRPDVITSILKQAALKGEGLYCDGCLEIVDEGGYGFLRDSKNNYKASSYDVYISQNQIKKFGLRQGDCIGAYIKEPRRANEKYFSVARLETINGKKIDEIKNKINFDNLTPLYPTEKLKFDKLNNQKEAISTRVIDLICPIGKGQRALIVAPPRAGKTLLMQAIAHAINENHPETELIVLLIDERPEEVTDMQRSVKGEVVSSTFDEPAKRHVELAEIVIEKARRMVEDGKDVIILLDSITRLARAYNATAPSSGKVLTGGVDSNALQKPKRFFGTARNIENGGSLTIIATALVETGSKMDEVIFEEFKGTGNAEIVLDRKLADKRLFPAVDILKSGTRKEEEMLSKDELQKMWILRRILIQMAGANTMNTSDALEFLIDKLKNSKDNQEFFANMNGSKSA